MFKNNTLRLLRRQNGQALLIVVLVMVVALTVGLSVASRSITNLKNSQDQASSQKALSAAEAGVEQAITSQNQSNLAGGFQQYNTNYQTTVSAISGGGSFLVHGNNSLTNEISKGNPVYVWTTNYSASNPWAGAWSGTLTISWGDPGGSCPNNTVPALEILVISGTKTNPIQQRYVYDPCPDRMTQNSGFINSPEVTFASPGILGLADKITLPHINNIFLVSVNPQYADTRIGISTAAGDPALPNQGSTITSTGTADNQVQRKIVVFQSFPQLPACLLSYTLCSP